MQRACMLCRPSAALTSFFQTTLLAASQQPGMVSLTIMAESPASSQAVVLDRNAQPLCRSLTYESSGPPKKGATINNRPETLLEQDLSGPGDARPSPLAALTFGVPHQESARGDRHTQQMWV